MAYEGTTVSVERSQGAIRSLLVRHGAREFTFGEGEREDGARLAVIAFVAHGRAVRMRVPHKAPSAQEVSRKYSRTRGGKTHADVRGELEEQEAKRIWRVLHWIIKSRMEAVAEGVETFEEAFLAHLLDSRTGRTVYEQLAEHGSVDLGAPLALPAGDDDGVADAVVVS